MIRILLQNSMIFTNNKRFMHISTSNLSATKSDDFTKIFQRIKKDEGTKCEETKRLVQAEVHLWHSLQRQCINPASLTDEQWQHLYELEAKHQRKRYCRHLLMQIEAKGRKKELAEIERESKKGNRERILAEREANPHLSYGLGQNSLLIRVNTQTINKWITMKMHRTKMHGQKIVLDCSYENYMTDLERSKVAKGLKRLYTENRKHIKPLDLHLCGINSNSVIIKNLSGQIPTLMNKSSPTEVHTQCVTELFPKDRLVMLSADSENVLEYNFDDIYVIGAIVDLGRNDPLTLAKAKKLGIRSARLPLDDLRMSSGDSRELPISSVAAVIREHQINSNVQEIIRKCVYLSSERRKQREAGERLDNLKGTKEYF